MSRPALSLLLLAAVAAVALLLFWNPGSRGDRPAAEPAAESESPGAAALAGGTRDPDHAVARESAESDVPAPQPEQADGPRASSDDPDAILVRVVHADGGAPAPHAEVLHLDRGTIPRETFRAAIGPGADFEAFLEEHGTLYRADARGEVRVPPATSYADVAARKGGKFGLVYAFPSLSEREDVAVVELLPVAHLKARVVDERGRPQEDVPVVIEQSFGPGTAGHHRTTFTDASGLAEIRHAEQILRGMQRGDVRLAVALPLPRPVHHAFAIDAPPLDTVVLRLPATGAVRVRALGPDGAPVPDGRPIVLQERMPEEERERRQGSFSILEHLGGHTRFTEDGEVVFPHVGLGLDLECGGVLDESGAYTAVALRGPEQPGQEVQVALRQAVERPSVTCRLVDAEGSPHAGLGIVGVFERQNADGTGTRAGLMATLDEEGGFQRTLEEREAPAGARRWFRFLRREPGLLLLGRLEVPASLDAGENDLGEVVLGGPVIVSGVVQDAAGTPVPDARVSLQDYRYRPPHDATYWMSRRGEYVETDEAGRFAFRGPLAEGRYRVQVRGPGESGGGETTREFSVGAEDLVVLLAAKGGLEAQVLTDPGVPRDLLWVVWEADAPAPPGARPLEKRAEPDRASGKVGFDGLEPGPCAVAVTFRGAWDELVRVEDVMVRGGEVTRDPRLNPIDLRGRLHFHRVVVRDAEGEALSPATVNVLSGERSLSWSDRSGTTEFLTTEAPLPAVVWAEGHRAREITLDGGEREVVLQGGVPVRLQLNGATLPRAEHRWTLSLHSVEPENERRWGPMHVGGVFLAEGDPLRFVLPHPGTWQLRLTPQLKDPQSHPSGGNWAPVRFGGEPHLTLQVEDAVGEQTLTVPLEAEAIQQALEELVRETR